MTFLPTVSARLGRSTAAVITAAAFAVLGGCQNDTTPPMQSNNTNSSAVQAQNTGTMNSDASKYDTMSAFPTGDKASSVLMVEAMGSKSVRLNKDATTDVKVTNLTDMPVKNVVLMSTTPDGYKMSGATGGMGQAMAVDGGKMGVPVGDLGPKESKTITITGTATKASMIDTCYSVSYNPPTLCTHVDVTNPAISLAVVAPADSDICQPVKYTYTVKNTGTGAAKNVMLEEQLPDGLMTTDGKQMVSAQLGDIPQGESREATAMLKAAPTVKTGTPMSGKAVAKSDGESAPEVDTSTTFHAPMLAVALTGGGTNGFVGTTVPYSAVVTNKGDAVAHNVKLQLGHGAGDATVVATGVDAGGMVSIGDLQPNQSSNPVSATVTTATAGTVNVIAKATGDCSPDAMANASSVFNTAPSLLLETTDNPDPANVGSTVVYDIKVTNQSAGPDNNIAVKATIPDGETYVSTAGDTQPTQDGQTLTFPTIATLGAKESVTWKVTVKAVKAGDVQFKTNATCDGTAPAEKVEPTKLVGQ